MKLFRLALVLVMAFAVAGFAQTMCVGVQGGYAMSAFEDQDEAASAIPVGAFFGYGVAENIQVGAEFSMLVSPFAFDVGMDDDMEITQTIIGAFGKYMFPMEGFVPYAKAGVGYYMGKAELGDFDENFKGAIGFNVGGGVQTAMGVYGEFVYHIVSRELDVEGAESGGANNWGIHVGYKFNF